MLNEDELRDAVLLVFANKQDLPNAMVNTPGLRRCPYPICHGENPGQQTLPDEPETLSTMVKTPDPRH